MRSSPGSKAFDSGEFPVRGGNNRNEIIICCTNWMQEAYLEVRHVNVTMYAFFLNISQICLKIMGMSLW